MKPRKTAPNKISKMTNMIRKTKSKGRGIETFTKTISEDEMERLLEMQHDEVIEILDEAYTEQARGVSDYLEPLHVFLNEARESFEASKAGD
jgi:hypothetical protein